ncbi:MAG: hypothetical protein AAB759_00475 [Patescibacteria group bacterium]
MKIEKVGKIPEEIDPEKWEGKITCEKCGTIFSFRVKDIATIITGRVFARVLCPLCNRELTYWDTSEPLLKCINKERVKEWWIRKEEEQKREEAERPMTWGWGCLVPLILMSIAGWLLKFLLENLSGSR